jgi:1,4-dihydroxy-2-naphthoate octaprenyltransferase
MEEIRVNSSKAWMLAARPKTLTGAAVPVMMALSLAWVDCHVTGIAFKWIPALLCLLFAFLMQIDANFINDYFDFMKGTDDESRLGPRRACAQGWVTTSAMRCAMVVTTLAACVVGLPLIIYGGITMVLVGLVCVVFCFLYTTHLSYLGLGDVLVLVFFGIVPVSCTYYLQTNTLTKEVVVSSIACGLVIDTLLIVNNYRDRDTDRVKGKHTLVIMIGDKAAEQLFFMLGLLAILLGLLFFFTGRYLIFLLPLFYLMLHVRTYQKMKRIRHGKALNLILGENARNMFIYGIVFSIGVLLDYYLF